MESNPQGASVRVNGSIVGTTPYNTQVETGTYQIEISLTGYETYEETVYLTARKDFTATEAGQVYKNLIPLPPPRVIGITEPVTRNIDWTPQRKDFNGTTMVLVSAGSFKMGSTESQINAGWTLCNEGKTDGDCPKSWFEVEGPINVQSFAEPFWIDETEVSRGAYESCVSAGVCTSTPDSQYSTTANQPINRVTWYQAAAYCEWREARLPTEAEWEYAARGPDNLIYPWGNSMVGHEANHCDSNCANADWFKEDWVYKNPNNNDSYAETAPVKSYPNSVSWVGALNMSGNVYEWVSSLYKGYPYVNNDGRNLTGNETSVTELIALRGGSFFDPADFLRAAFRLRVVAGVGSASFGFRCARSNSGF